MRVTRSYKKKNQLRDYASSYNDISRNKYTKNNLELGQKVMIKGQAYEVIEVYKKDDANGYLLKNKIGLKTYLTDKDFYDMGVRYGRIN